LSRCAAICFLSLAFAGCRRTTGPDENYQQASAIYQQLYATQLDDAYGDPKMDEVVALLGKVDPRSVDAHAAGSMLGAIQRGREELAKQHAERERMAAAARSAAPVVDIDPSKFLAATAPEAGPPQDPFGPGASVAELNTQTGGCLVDNEPFNEQGTGVGGTVYRVAPSDGCRSKLPGLVGQVVLVVNGKVYRRTADPRPPPPPPAADAGVPAGRPAASAARPAQPADAGEPGYYITAPGQPQPGATPPQAEQPR
jgi:hypothetical protein